MSILITPDPSVALKEYLHGDSDRHDGRGSGVAIRYYEGINVVEYHYDSSSAMNIYSKESSYSIGDGDFIYKLEYE